MQWYRFIPVDTLFFKGAEPMNLGENHTASHIFPPPAQTLAGALRTAVLTQNNVSFQHYGKNAAPDEIYGAIGRPGKPAPFDLIGPLFMVDDEVYVPAPYSWFTGRESGNGADETAMRVIRGKPLTSSLIKAPSKSLIWAKGNRDEMISLGGRWIKLNELDATHGPIQVRKTDSFFKEEQRTGIALQQNRTVRDGYLYSFTHARLNPSVSLLFGTDRELPLSDKGTLKVGGEQRFGWYEKLSGDFLSFDEGGETYLSLSLLEGTGQTNHAIVATGPIQYVGGWDLHKGFHKPMKGYFPAGTVCGKKMNHNFISLKGDETC